MKQSITIRVPASTSNLGSCIDTVGLALELYNTFAFTLDSTTKGVSVKIDGHGSSDVEQDCDNLAYRALASVYESFGLNSPGIHIHQNNGIPISRGFGGSATAILAGVMAAYEFLGKRASNEEIIARSVAIDGFTDNLTAALFGGMVVSTLEDGVTTYVRLHVPSQLKAVIYVPDMIMPTGKSRQVLPKQVSFNDAVFNIRASTLLIAAFATGSFDKLKFGMRDRLHQSYRATLLPEMNLFFEAALNAGALGVALNGAGSGILAFVLEDGQRVAQAMSKAGLLCGLGGYALQLNVEDNGAKIVHRLGIEG
jgi:homoserine kinase